MLYIFLAFQHLSDFLTDVHYFHLHVHLLQHLSPPTPLHRRLSPQHQCTHHSHACPPSCLQKNLPDQEKRLEVCTRHQLQDIQQAFQDDNATEKIVGMMKSKKHFPLSEASKLRSNSSCSSGPSKLRSPSC